MNGKAHEVLAGVVLALALAAVPTRAEAAPRAERRIWLEVRPRAAAAALAAFASNVGLACDALAGECEVARGEDDATERATLFCDERGPWTVGLVRDGESDGEAIVVALAGDREERLRRAAMWIARARLEPPVVAETAPPPDPASDGPEGDEPGVDASLRPYPFPFAVEQPAPRQKPPRPPARYGIALSGSVGIGSSGGQWGLDGQVALPLWHSFYWGPFGSYQLYGDADFGSIGGNDPPAGHGALGGLTVGWGAPFDDQWFGFSFTAGAGATWGTGSWAASPCSASGACTASAVADGRGATGLFRAGFGVQLPLKGWPVRPTLSTATNMSNQLGSFAVMQTLDFGLVWQAL